ncbi:hypothetical protein [Oceaniradius stylonematis]|uniref:hypothetical protein n=1 Tax=Oceaniradius stylonematis TaxID=2184161 RepID=UPI00273D54B7|nr:hypothetical protein [Oceaniradius stylonematis]
MGEDVSLPEPVQEVFDEIERIKKKIEKLGEIDAPAALIATLNDALKNAINAVNEHLGTEAKKEIGALGGMAQLVGQGLVADGAVEKNEDLEDLGEVDDEKKKIAEKLKVARKHRDGVEDENDIRQVEKGVDELDDAIREAAIEAAKRELDALKKKIDKIKKGEPDKDKGKGPGAKPTPPKPDDKKKDGGGGKPDEKEDDKDEDKKKEIKAPKVHTIYVRDQTTVWAWNPRTGEWVPMDFGGEIVEVKLIKGGILAFSAERAAIYDSYVGIWLEALDVPGGELVKGDAKTDD